MTAAEQSLAEILLYRTGSDKAGVGGLVEGPQQSEARGAGQRSWLQWQQGRSPSPTPHSRLMHNIDPRLLLRHTLPVGLPWHCLSNSGGQPC